MLNELLGPDIEILVADKKFDEVAAFFAGHHPAEDAELMAAMDAAEIKELLVRMTPDVAAPVLCELPDAVQVSVAELLSREELTHLLEKMPPDERADLAKGLSEEQLDEVSPFLAQKEREDLKKLVAWPEGTAGSVMTTDYISFPETMTVRQAIESIRHAGAKKGTISTIYTFDANRRLSGYLTLEDLILAKPFLTLGEAKNDLVAEITANADREEAVYNMSKYGLVMLPVVNENGMLIGNITHDDIIDIIEEERTEDMERFMAISGEHEDTSYLQTSVWTQFRRRVPWLVVLAGCGVLSGMVLQSFEAVIAQLMLLTFYMPMLTDAGGNTGSQAATVIMRALTLKEIKPQDVIRVLWKELRVAVLLGVVLGVLAFVRVELLSASTGIPAGMALSRIALTIGFALFVQVLTATIIGALLPLIASLFKIDPALVASPALTTVVDITGLLIYFGLARVLLGV